MSSSSSDSDDVPLASLGARKKPAVPRAATKKPAAKLPAKREAPRSKSKQSIPASAAVAPATQPPAPRRYAAAPPPKKAKTPPPPKGPPAGDRNNADSSSDSSDDDVPLASLGKAKPAGCYGGNQAKCAASKVIVPDNGGVCERHNEVNAKLGKPLVSCELRDLDERWRHSQDCSHRGASPNDADA